MFYFFQSDYIFKIRLLFVKKKKPRTSGRKFVNITIVSQSLLAKTRPILKLYLCVSEKRDTALIRLEQQELTLSLDGKYHRKTPNTRP